MSHLVDNIMTIVNTKGDHAYVGASLLIAGVLPMGMFSNFLQTVYFMLLIPPAAYHCYLWGRKAVYPVIKKLFKNSEP